MRFLFNFSILYLLIKIIIILYSIIIIDSVISLIGTLYNYHFFKHYNAKVL